MNFRLRLQAIICAQRTINKFQMQCHHDEPLSGFNNSICLALANSQQHVVNKWQI